MTTTRPEQLPELSEEQAAVFADIKSGANVLVTGGAGTGKSLLLKHLLAHYKSRIAVTGSTGISAVGVGGTTLHSFAGMGLARESAKHIAANILERRGAPYDRILGAERIAIDEVSMIGPELLDKFNDVLQIIRKSSKPFGGVQIIALGDFCQLEPVRKKEIREEDSQLVLQNEEDEAIFAFQAESWKRANFRVHVLQKVFRQTDQEFVKVLGEIRKGTLSESGRALLNERVLAIDPEPHKPAVIIHTHNIFVDSLNADHLESLPGESKKWVANDMGEKRGIEALQKHCIAPTFVELKVGARVMLLTNLEIESGLANGSVGFVKTFDVFGRPEVAFDNGQVRIIDRHTWELKEAKRVIAQRIQIPLRLARAVTAHKVQGATLDKAAIHLEQVFADGQAYVMLSRVRSKEGLFIASGNRKAIRASPVALKFYEDAALTTK